MKSVLIIIGFCIIILTGCTQQFSNAKKVNRHFSDRNNYDIASSCENVNADGRTRESLEYGPRIDLVKLIWGD